MSLHCEFLSLYMNLDPYISRFSSSVWLLGQMATSPIRKRWRIITVYTCCSVSGTFLWGSATSSAMSFLSENCLSPGNWERSPSEFFGWCDLSQLHAHLSCFLLIIYKALPLFPTHLRLSLGMLCSIRHRPKILQARSIWLPF